ncbi:hypothetical protein EC9_13570 [Rosistilla ulvae]|uniref:3-keto-alpha-glucoside-1,2-lyase/3-keto-2-hydroxy-glucal hydratase domain-containing protein n=1 Tax=Rosistilla ulvae TaxID=1930277 RepID=A0A517LX46_9BACT|nr:DUF1080 domain-containing protein [Rosistilla ulvae]QDS87180.1 hypothetical protein EC9_13570 [Rosistilla ulvae]
MHRSWIVALVLLLAPTANLWSQQEDDGFVPMFNGKDLAGWQLVNTDPRTWSVEEGMLICSGKPIGELRTDRMYQNFIMEVEWRHMVPKGNAGIFVWADDITAKGQPFHRGIEVQILENAYGKADWFTTHGDIFPIHGAKMTPGNDRGGSRAFPTEMRSLPTPQWNHYRIEAIDGAISLAVNGKVVTRGTDCNPRKGYLCIESEGGVVHYRNVKIKELPDTPIEANMIAIADRGYRCLYTGIDLTGWSVQQPEGAAKQTAEEAAGHWKPSDWVLSCTGAAGTNLPLASDEAFGDYGFVVDFRLNRDSGSPQIRLRGDAAAVAIAGDDSPLTQHLDKVGKWNRIEGEVRGDKVSLTINGTEIEPFAATGSADAKGPLTLVPDGPVDFTNLFVR